MPRPLTPQTATRNVSFGPAGLVSASSTLGESALAKPEIAARLAASAAVSCMNSRRGSVRIGSTLGRDGGNVIKKAGQSIMLNIRRRVQRHVGKASDEEYPSRGFSGRRRAGRGWYGVRGRRPASHAGRASRPTCFAGGRLEAGDPRNARRPLGSIKSNLNPARVERIKRSVAQVDVTEGFQQAAGEIFQAPE